MKLPIQPRTSPTNFGGASRLSNSDSAGLPMISHCRVPSPEKANLPVRRWIQDRDRRQFHAEGYVVVRNVVPLGVVRNAARDIAAFVRADLADSSTWYRGAPQLDGIVPLHHAQSLWNIRQSPNLYQVFAEFFGNARLMVDMNRCIFRPPVHSSFPGLSCGTVHWDTDPRRPESGSLQAVVVLSDVGRKSGGFQ